MEPSAWCFTLYLHLQLIGFTLSGKSTNFYVPVDLRADSSAQQSNLFASVNDLGSGFECKERTKQEWWLDSLLWET